MSSMFGEAFGEASAMFADLKTSAASAGLSVAPRPKSKMGQSDEFKAFRGTYALRQLAVDLNEGEWRYFEGGPRDVQLLLCLPGASGTAESMFRIMQGLCPKGYRVIAAQPPPYYTVNEFVLGLDAFLDAVEASQVHVFGASLGGFLAQQFALHRPKRVASLVLCNSFYSTEPFATTGGTILTPMYQFTPAFVLKNLILSSFTSEVAPQGEGAKPSPVADATDFVVEQLDTLYQGDLASRLTLNCTPLDCAGIKLAADKITLIDSLDKTSRPAELREELYRRYAESKQAQCRVGGDFPFLSVADDVNLYIEVHLRRQGLLVNKPQLDESAPLHLAAESEAPERPNPGRAPRPPAVPPPSANRAKLDRPLFQD